MTKIERLLITPTLLNSWLYIFQSRSPSLAYTDFIKTLSREKTPPNSAMQKGIDFEEQCYQGKTNISPIIENGSFQLVGSTHFYFDNIDMLCYGRLDVLKNGVIYDIKRVKEYEVGKYQWSSQHWFYMYLFPQVKYFEYLVEDDTNSLHKEKYLNDTKNNPTESYIIRFIEWLKENDLYELYKTKWEVR